MKRNARSVSQAVILGCTTMSVFGGLAYFSTAPWALVWGCLSLVGLAVTLLGLLGGMAFAKRKPRTGPGRVRRFGRAVRDTGSTPWLMMLVAAFYGGLAYWDLHDAVTDTIARKDDSATWNLIFGVALLYAVKLFATSAFRSAGAARRRAREARVARRVEELANGGGMTGEQLRSLSRMACEAQDWEEGEALREAARLVDERAAELARQGELIALRRFLQLHSDLVRATRHSNTPGAF